MKDSHKGGISDLKAQSQFTKYFNDIEIINESFEDLKLKSKNLMMQYFLKQRNQDKAKFYL